LISYDAAGKERWKLALAPFNTPYGFASSPILAGNRLLLVADLDAGSYLLALDKDTGKQLWKTVRREATHGYPSPVIYQPVNAAPQVIVSGSFQLASYSLATGEKLWWVDGLAWQAKSMPLIHNHTIYVHSWMASLSEIGLKENVPPFQQMLTQNDADKDGKLSADEVPDPEMKKYWFLFDLDKDNFITAYDWNIHLSRSHARNGLLAIKPGTKGDVSSSNILWRYEKSLPNIPSPVIYNSVLFVLKEGGILTSLDPATGSVLKQGRVEGALGSYFSSPVAADGKLYLLSKDGKLAVLKAAADWELLQLNDLGEDCWGTPAIADGKIYARTMQALYCFAAPVA
ncbi:MAG: PQQ-binding-like beta-propeller repeat protein, partial [Acidobacteriia bacterium]|nr:PQQ-binding-like beta-propeller repeat protein [Terriglobia bacterium]